jgi:DNA (cytosine-5)-methyltransferase 1
MNLIGIDLFSGAGGMSLGATFAGIKMKLAIEIDKNAAITYKNNHPDAIVLNQDIRKVNLDGLIKIKKNEVKILFGGPPCQGFSTSNQKTRNKINSNNWLFKEFLRITKDQRPDWLIVENVKGILDTENGFFFEKIQADLNKMGYTTTYKILNAADFGVPQIRNRIFIVGSLHGIKFQFPQSTATKLITVNEALSDLPNLKNGTLLYEMDYRSEASCPYQITIRENSQKSINNLVTKNTELIIQRYKYIPQGGNWRYIPEHLMSNYKDHERCHTRIYYRLKSDEPSVVIGNYRKNMLIHPFENRGLSVREAARIQSFPDNFHFYGSIGFQQQQVGNSVPPLLSEAIFKKIVHSIN